MPGAPGPGLPKPAGRLGSTQEGAWGPVLMAGRSREKTEDAEQGRAESGSDTRDSPTAADARLHHGWVTGGA